MEIKQSLVWKRLYKLAEGDFDLAYRSLSEKSLEDAIKVILRHKLDSHATNVRG